MVSHKIATNKTQQGYKITVSKPILLKCPKCGHEFYTRSKRPQCSQCKYNFPRKKLDVKTSNLGDKTSIQKNILNGSILKAMDQMGMNPLKKNALGDCILYVLDDDELILALNKASKKMKRKPVALIRKVVRGWLEKEKYLPLKGGCT